MGLQDRDYYWNKVDQLKGKQPLPDQRKPDPQSDLAKLISGHEVKIDQPLRARRATTPHAANGSSTWLVVLAAIVMVLIAVVSYVRTTS